MRLAWAAVLCGCGRLGFGPQAGGDAAPNDAVADIGVDAFAICHTGTWGMPQPLQINTLSHESDATLTADGLTMFYTSNRVPSDGYAIWTATRASTTVPFGGPMRVAELDDLANDQDPSISPDGLTIYFDSDRIGAMLDIFVATRTSTAVPFGPASPVVINGDPSTIRTTAAVAADGLSIYYGSGALEIAYATRSAPAGAFTFARELDEVNVPSTDNGPMISDDGLELFFESFRTGTAATFRSTRATTTEMWSPATELTELVTAVPGAIASGGPHLTPDGRTLYIFLNITMIDLYSVTRSCD